MKGNFGIVVELKGKDFERERLVPFWARDRRGRFASWQLWLFCKFRWKKELKRRR